MKNLKIIKTICIVFLLLLLTVTESFSQRLTVSSTGSKILKDGNPLHLEE